MNEENIEQYDKKIMEQCIELSKQGIDLEQLFKDIKPIFDIIQPIIDLGLKNYKFIKGLGDDTKDYGRADFISEIVSLNKDLEKANKVTN
jgi:hypothetical protein